MLIQKLIGELDNLLYDTVGIIYQNIESNKIRFEIPEAPLPNNALL